MPCHACTHPVLKKALRSPFSLHLFCGSYHLGTGPSNHLHPSTSGSIFMFPKQATCTNPSASSAHEMGTQLNSHWPPWDPKYLPPATRHVVVAQNACQCTSYSFLMFCQWPSQGPQNSTSWLATASAHPT